MSSFRALIFDVDGTLADTEEAHRQAFNAAFADFGLDWVWTPELYAELLLVTGGKERIASHIAGLELSPGRRRRLLALIPQLHRTKTRHYTELATRGRIPLRAGVGRLIGEARQAGVRLGIASTTSPENITPLLSSSLGPEAVSWFHTIAAGDVVPSKKPAPDIYHFAMAALRVAPECAIAVEDSAPGVQSAKAAGLFTVAAPSRWTSSQDLSAADLVIRSLGMLSFASLAALHAARCPPG